jgi:hypothetical protein
MEGSYSTGQSPQRAVVPVEEEEEEEEDSMNRGKCLRRQTLFITFTFNTFTPTNYLQSYDGDAPRNARTPSRKVPVIFVWFEPKLKHLNPFS